MTTIHVPSIEYEFNYEDAPRFEPLRSKRKSHRKREGSHTAARKRRRAVRSIHKDIRHAVDAVKQGSFEEGTRRTLASLERDRQRRLEAASKQRLVPPA